MKYIRLKLIVFWRHWLWIIKHWHSLLILLTLLTAGCGIMKYNSTLILPDGKKVTLESNVPTAAEGDGYKIDQRGLSIIEKLIPQNIRIEK